MLSACAITGTALWMINTQPKTELTTTSVIRADLEQTVLAVGRLRAKELVAVGAQVSGQVTRLHVTLGQQVKAGDIIAEVDAQPQRIALRNAEALVVSLQAQLAARRAALVQTELTYRRQQELLSVNATSKADHEAAKAALDSARAETLSLGAQVEQANTQVETSRINVGYTRIVAPMDGIIIAVVTKQGQTLNSLQTTPTIVMLAKLDVMTVRAEIAEADVNKIQVGQKVWFTTLGDTRHSYVSQIAQVEPAPESIINDAGGRSGLSSAGTNTSRAVYYNALFDVPNPEGHLRPSMTAQVTVLISQVKQAVLVPTAALGKRDSDDVYAVRIVDDQGRPSTRQVRIGRRTHSMAQVLSGLEPGEHVVIGETSLAPPSIGPDLMGY